MSEYDQMAARTLALRNAGHNCLQTDCQIPLSRQPISCGQTPCAVPMPTWAKASDSGFTMEGLEQIVRTPIPTLGDIFATTRAPRDN